jgi:hypothetical protein
MTETTTTAERPDDFEQTYRAILTALHACGRANEDLKTEVAIMVLVDMAYDAALASGLLWRSPDLVAELHTLAEKLEERRRAEPEGRPLLGTVREFFAAGRPAVMQ